MEMHFAVLVELVVSATLIARIRIFHYTALIYLYTKRKIEPEIEKVDCSVGNRTLEIIKIVGVGRLCEYKKGRRSKIKLSTIDNIC